ncbi:DUF4150 domain-containing protein [Agrobacterium rosae]|uniref:DUF4150 domain-containing protein n=1 Tax=Agrobacterium rosae TaxID=1972867 RepID=UPI002A107735|nr:DUF4150 domain-containing protein [Agrobacterium rosae]MDX8314460.1 DUF4150 domain-containing protein [Agrobacterium rosae]
MQTTPITLDRRDVTAEALSTGAIGRNNLLSNQPVYWNRGGSYFYQARDPYDIDTYVEFNDEELEKKLREDEEAKAKQPPPTAPDPHPPELVPDEGDVYAVCLSPDVCRTPEKPIPYMSWGKADDKTNYSPNVRSNGKVIKRQDSKFFCCYGDEPGIGKGVKSGTVKDVVEPVTSSAIVRANGIPVQRHTDRCTLNNGNCPGEYIHVKSTQTSPAPDGKDEHDKTRDEQIADYAASKGYKRADDGGWNTNPNGVGWASNDKLGEEMDYVKSGKGNVQPMSLGSGPSEIKSYTPSWTESIKSSVQDRLMSWGMDRYQALQWGEKVSGIAGFAPGVGNSLSGNEAYRAYASGHPVLGTIHAIGAIPIPGAAKVAEKLGVKAAESAAEKAAIRAAEKKATAKVAEDGADTTVPKSVTINGKDGVRSSSEAVKLTKDQYDKLRKKTPNRKMREKVNKGEPLATEANPVDDKWLPGMKRTSNLEADHIVSMKDITEMDGFSRLTQENQLKVLNNPDNFTGLSRSANGSKGAKSFEEWTSYGSGGNAVPVNPDLRNQMIDRSNSLRPALQNQINDLLESQR